MKLKITLSECSDKCNDWREFCHELGLNPWCMNDGLAQGSDCVEIEIGTAKRYGLIKD